MNQLPYILIFLNHHLISIDNLMTILTISLMLIYMISVMNSHQFLFSYPYLTNLFIIEFESSHSSSDLLSLAQIDLNQILLNIIVNVILNLMVDEVNYVS